LLPKSRTAARGKAFEKICQDCTSQDSRLGENERSWRASIRRHGVACNAGRTTMKTIVSALIALSVLAGIAAPASAMDAKAFYEQQDRVSH